MRVLLPVLAAVAALAATSSPAAASPAHGADVDILTASFGAPRIDVLAGDTVTWRNASVRVHTVTAAAGDWASPRLAMHGDFSRRFDAPGVAAYYCQIHPTMRAEVDVHRLLLSGPHGGAAPDAPFELTGRAALPAGTEVAIEDAAGAVAAQATVDAHGDFRATVRARTTTTYRAVTSGDASPAVQVLVLDRKVSAAVRDRGRKVVIDARVRPASPGAKVVLQFRLRERFGWWPVRSANAGRTSRARFSLRVRRPTWARVVRMAPDGHTPLAISPPLRVGPRR
jgi:plastocyanin